MCRDTRKFFTQYLNKTQRRNSEKTLSVLKYFFYRIIFPNGYSFLGIASVKNFFGKFSLWNMLLRHCACRRGKFCVFPPPRTMPTTKIICFTIFCIFLMFLHPERVLFCLSSLGVAWVKIQFSSFNDKNANS